MFVYQAIVHDFPMFPAALQCDLLRRLVNQLSKHVSRETHFCDADFRYFVLSGLCVHKLLKSVGDVIAVLRGGPTTTEWQIN